MKDNVSGWEMVGIGVIVLLLLGALLYAQVWILMMAWNIVIPALFHGPTITMVQSLGITAVLSIIGSFFRFNNTNQAAK